jgi:UDP-glucuronate decarboxylase
MTTAQATTSEPPDPPLTRWYPLAVFALAVVWVVRNARDQFVGDEWRYVWYAGNLLKGYFSPSGNEMIWNGPAYPLWLAPFLAAGAPLIVPKLTNAAMLAGAVAYLHRALRLYCSPARATVGGLALGLSPLVYQTLHLLLTETMAVFFMAGLVFHFCASQAFGSRRHAAAAGLFLGGLALTKVSFGPPLVLGLGLSSALWALRVRPPAVKGVIEAGLVALAACAPWLLYTYRFSGKLFYWASSGGQSFYWMTSPHKEELGDWFHNGNVHNVPSLREHHAPVYDRMIGDLNDVAGTELDRVMPGVGRLCSIKADQEFWRLGLAQLAAHPLSYLRNGVLNAGRLFFDYPYTLHKRHHSATLIALHVLVVGAAAAVGARRLRGRLALPRAVEVVALFGLVETALSLALSAYGRFFLALYPAYLLVGLVGTAPGRWQPLFRDGDEAEAGPRTAGLLLAGFSPRGYEGRRVMGLGSTRKTVLITGVAGFLGSHLADRLLAEGFEVVGLDNLMTGDLDNLQSAGRSSHFHLEIGDVRETLKVYAEVIYNLACPASPVHYQSDPYATLTSSVIGAVRLAEHARSRRVRIVHASTSEVYGDPLEHPQREGYWGHVNPIGERACYDEGKRAAETVLMDARRVHGADVRIARIFNTYGPRMALNDGRVVSNFLRQAIVGRPIALYGDGSQSRSFCYVSDLIDGIVRLGGVAALESPVVNLGNPSETTMVELARTVMKVSGRRVELRHEPLPADDPRRRCPDISLARELLGFAPRVPLEQGLAATYADFLGRLDGAPAAEAPHAPRAEPNGAAGGAS